MGNIATFPLHHDPDVANTAATVTTSKRIHGIHWSFDGGTPAVKLTVVANSVQVFARNVVAAGGDSVRFSDGGLNTDGPAVVTLPALVGQKGILTVEQGGELYPYSV